MQSLLLQASVNSQMRFPCSFCSTEKERERKKEREKKGGLMRVRYLSILGIKRPSWERYICRGSIYQNSFRSPYSL